MEDGGEETRYQPVGWREAMEEDGGLVPHRPFGVSVLAVLDMLAAALILFVLIVVGWHDGSANAPDMLFAPGPLALLWFEVVTGMAAAVGLWTLKEWGRLLAVARAAGVVVVLLVSNAAQAVTGGLLLQVLISVIVITYLLQARVREQFQF